MERLAGLSPVPSEGGCPVPGVPSEGGCPIRVLDNNNESFADCTKLQSTHGDLTDYRPLGFVENPLDLTCQKVAIPEGFTYRPTRYMVVLSVGVKIRFGSLVEQLNYENVYKVVNLIKETYCAFSEPVSTDTLSEIYDTIYDLLAKSKNDRFVFVKMIKKYFASLDCQDMNIILLPEHNDEQIGYDVENCLGIAVCETKPKFKCSPCTIQFTKVDSYKAMVEEFISSAGLVGAEVVLYLKS
jgi:hypothetical protein